MYDVAKLSRHLICPECGAHGFDFSIQAWVAVKDGKLQNIDLQRLHVAEGEWVYCRECSFEGPIASFMAHLSAEETTAAFAASKFIEVKPEALDVSQMAIEHL